MVTFRSDPMKHGTLVIPSDRGHEFVELMGRKCVIEFKDMNVSSMRRPYKRYIQRIEEMERILRFLFDEINKLPGAHIEANKTNSFLGHSDVYQLDVVETSLQKLYSQFVKFRDNNADLMKQKYSAIEEKAVVKAATSSLVPGVVTQIVGGDEYTEQGLLEAEVEGGGSSMGFSNMAGVILQRDQEKFARTLFRVTRGNTFTHFDAIDEPLGLDEDAKSVVVIYFQGSPTSALFEKITKICQAFGVSTYLWPRSHAEAMDRIGRLDDIILDKGKALQAYEDFFLQEISVLLEVNYPVGNSLIEEWRLFALQEKSIYATLNKFEGADVTLRGDCWFPASEEDVIRQLLQSHSNNLQASAFLLTDRPGKTRGMPPTYFRTTEFTLAYQNFVDTYGIASYREANPALLTIVTFPYLFGIMYGDIGHGGLIALFGLFLVLSNSKGKDAPEEIVRMLYGGRYMIFMMGCFAIFSGFLYNDFFSLGINIFGSRYQHQGASIEWVANDKNQPFPYPFGFDPIWKGASNELVFFNSFKMKYSVIVAFFQMGTGVIIKLLNSIHFGDWPTAVFEFCPQIIFFFSLVGYMDFLIFLKWIQPMSSPKPSIITTLINMFMMIPPTEEEKFFDSQATVQKILVLFMLICVPLMLLPKPFILRAQAKRKAAQKPLREDDVMSLTEEGGQAAAASHARTGGPHDEDEEEFSFGECFIHQMIETIEFVLGAISNTASYLRLWALSLAHQQLALVFFNITVLAVLKQKVAWYILGIMLFFVFAVFATITFSVMLCMDTLECFLHALRLQWVEFQSKFFKAAGHKFVPFQFSRILSNQDED